MTTAPTRPVLRYFGGKWALAPWCIAHFPRHKTYCECYGGAGSVLMQKARSRVEVYNDIDSRLVNVFRVLQDPVKAAELERVLRVTPWSREEYELAQEPVEEPIEAARRLIIMAFQGHGSGGLRGELLCGWRSKDDGANGHAAHAWVNYPDQIRVFCERLQGVVLEHRDALVVIRQHDTPTTLHFVDPPYVRNSRKSRHGYTHDMDDQQHRDLHAVLCAVDGAVVLCGYPSELYDELYSTWFSVNRKHVSIMGGERTERLWLNERAAAGHRRLF